MAKKIQETISDAAKPKGLLNKLNYLRCAILDLDITKTGHNKFQNFHYFQLSDFIKPAQQICKEIGLFVGMDITTERGRATVYDCDNTENSMIFDVPYKDFQLKGANDVQIVGAVITYLRRYLWQLILDLIEVDEVDAIDQNLQKPKQENKAPASVNQRKEIIQEKTTNSNEKITPTQLTAISAGLKKLISYNLENINEWIKSFRAKYKDFQSISKGEAEVILTMIADVIKKVEKGDK